MVSRQSAYDEHDAFLCACKGEPYTVQEWAAEVQRLSDALVDASERWQRAERDGVCLPKRFDPEGATRRIVEGGEG